MPLIDSSWGRVELVPMDAHCLDISLALYRRDTEDGPVGLVHSYSSKPGAGDRVGFVAGAMVVLGGLEPAEDGTPLLRFGCGTWHGAAARRAFLEACKFDPAAPLAPPPLETVDGAGGQTIRVERLGAGSYRVVAEEPERASEVASGLAKLAELVPGDEPAVAWFSCGVDHDALVGLLLRRAINVRATLQEEEAKASRGLLVAPSAQAQGEVEVPPEWRQP